MRSNQSLTDRRTHDELKVLNRQYHCKELAPQEFYRQLEIQGIVLRLSVIVEIIPEGSNSFTGVLIRQDGVVLQFDIDLDDARYSEWTDVTIEFKGSLSKERRSRRVIAYGMFSALAGSGV